MSKSIFISVLCAILIALALSACVVPRQYHPPEDVSADKHSYYRLCEMPSPECEHNALQHFRDPDYTLGFIEFDDQGLLHDRDQADSVLEEIRTRVAKPNDNAIIVAFVHGWKHNAAPKDTDIAKFKAVLSRLSEAEDAISETIEEPAREVIGVYLGWRGKSIAVRGVWNFTFWGRKDTAHQVGHVGLTEVLAKLESIRNQANKAEEGSTRLVIIGHSLGGAAIYSALSQILQARFVRGLESEQEQEPIEGFGDLVVLINPAFEALLFTPLSDLSTTYNRYPDSQLPVLAILTSEADLATKYLFYIGRRLSALFETIQDDTTGRLNAQTEKWEEIDQNQANVTAVGHFEPYWTHCLRKAPAVERTALQAGADWIQDRAGNSIAFDGSVLTRTPDSAGQNPYLVVNVEEKLIPNHNDISSPEIIEFIKQMIVISSIPEQQAFTDVAQSPAHICEGE